MKVRTRLPRKLIKLRLRDLLKLDLSDLPTAHANTINKSLSILAAIVAHVMREGKMDRMPSYANPFQGIKLSLDDREAEGRGIFEAADLKAIFNTAVYRSGSRPMGGGGEAAFWLPLIALFTGARQSELAQLRIEDLRQDSETRPLVLRHRDRGWAINQDGKLTPKSSCPSAFGERRAAALSAIPYRSREGMAGGGTYGLTSSPMLRGGGLGPGRSGSIGI